MRNARVDRLAGVRRVRRGFTLVEIMAGIMLVALIVLALSAMFPLTNILRDRSGNYSRAATVVQKTLEEVRRLPFSQINYTGLRSAGIIDEGNTNPYSITTTNLLSTQLQNGSGTLALSGVGTDLITVTVTVNWTGFRSIPGKLEATSYVTNKEVWKLP